MLSNEADVSRTADFNEKYCNRLDNMLLLSRYTFAHERQFLTTGEERGLYDAHLRVCEL